MNPEYSVSITTSGYKIIDSKVYTSDESQYINVSSTATITSDGNYTLLTPSPVSITSITNYDDAETINVYINKSYISINEGTISKFYVSTDNKNTYAEVSNNYKICFGDNQYHDVYVYVLTTDGRTSEPYKITVYMGSCFTGDTKVKSENGYTNIEDIKVGDKVYSYNEITKTEELKDVTKTFIHDDNRIYEIKAGNKIIKVTPDHRIYVKKKYGNIFNWTKVYNIHEGDYLLDSNNKQVRIDSIKYYESKDDLKVYNIEVKDNHTYYVSDGNFLVHNAKGGYCNNPGVPSIS